MTLVVFATSPWGVICLIQNTSWVVIEGVVQVGCVLWHLLLARVSGGRRRQG
jgi:hypothetical protein